MENKKISDQAVLDATGKTPQDWYSSIQNTAYAGATHKEIARYLHEENGLSFWWAQTVTVLYEQYIGRRVLGQTADQGFQVGVSKTFYKPLDQLWTLLFEGPGIDLFLPGVQQLEPGDAGEAEEGIDYEVKVLEPLSHIRLRWKLSLWSRPSTLQIRLSPKSVDRCTVTFHHEGLRDEKVRQQMREHWREKLESLSKL